MALKTIDEAIACGLCSGGLGHVQNNLKSEIRDYMAHRVMLLPNGSTAMDLFVDIFKEGDSEKSNGNDKKEGKTISNKCETEQKP